MTESLTLNWGHFTVRARGFGGRNQIEARYVASIRRLGADLRRRPALVGDPDTVAARIREYQDVGIDTFILSGYPHAAEADLFARHVLPNIDHAPLTR